MKITFRVICAGLFAVLFLGSVAAPPAMAARTISAGDVVNGRYEEGLLGAAGTAGDPSTGQNKIPLTHSKNGARPVRGRALWSTSTLFSNAVWSLDHLLEWMRPFVAEPTRFHLPR